MDDAEKLNIALQNAATNALKSAISQAGGPEFLADTVVHRVRARVGDDGSFMVTASGPEGQVMTVDDLAAELKSEMGGAFRPKESPPPPPRREPEKKPEPVPSYTLSDWRLLVAMASRPERSELMRRLAANEIEVSDD